MWLFSWRLPVVLMATPLLWLRVERCSVGEMGTTENWDMVTVTDREGPDRLKLSGERKSHSWVDNIHYDHLINFVKGKDTSSVVERSAPYLLALPQPIVFCGNAVKLSLTCSLHCQNVVWEKNSPLCLIKSAPLPMKIFIYECRSEPHFKEISTCFLLKVHVDVMLFYSLLNGTFYYHFNLQTNWQKDLYPKPLGFLLENCLLGHKK